MTNDSRPLPAPLLSALALTGVAALWCLLRSAGTLLTVLASQADFTSFFPGSKSVLWATWAFYIVIPGLWGIAMFVLSWSVVERRPGSLDRLQIGVFLALAVVIIQGFLPSLWFSALGNLPVPSGFAWAYWLYKGLHLVFLGAILFGLRHPRSVEYVAPTLDEDDLPYHFRLG